MKKQILNMMTVIGLLALSRPLLAQSCLLPYADDPTPTPMIVYKTDHGYYLDSQTLPMQTFLKQLQFSLVADDPSPQPSINFDIDFDLVIPPIKLEELLDLSEVNFDLDLRTGCDLITESYLDRRGNLLRPVEQSEAAIECGCRMVDAGFHVFKAQLTANSVFAGGDCPI